MPCPACLERPPTTYLREPSGWDPTFDPTLGLTAAGDDVFVCPRCGQRYRRERTPASLFHDYDEYAFAKLDG